MTNYFDAKKFFSTLTIIVLLTGLGTATDFTNDGAEAKTVGPGAEDLAILNFTIDDEGDSAVYGSPSAGDTLTSFTAGQEMYIKDDVNSGNTGSSYEKGDDVINVVNIRGTASDNHRYTAFADTTVYITNEVSSQYESQDAIVKDSDDDGNLDDGEVETSGSAGVLRDFNSNREHYEDPDGIDSTYDADSGGYGEAIYNHNSNGDTGPVGGGSIRITPVTVKSTTDDNVSTVEWGLSDRNVKQITGSPYEVSNSLPLTSLGTDFEYVDPDGSGTYDQSTGDYIVLNHDSSSSITEGDIVFEPSADPKVVQSGDSEKGVTLDGDLTTTFSTNDAGPTPESYDNSDKLVLDVGDNGYDTGDYVLTAGSYDASGLTEDVDLSTTAQIAAIDIDESGNYNPSDNAIYVDHDTGDAVANTDVRLSIFDTISYSSGSTVQSSGADVGIATEDFNSEDKLLNTDGTGTYQNSDPIVASSGNKDLETGDTVVYEGAIGAAGKNFDSGTGTVELFKDTRDPTGEYNDEDAGIARFERFDTTSDTNLDISASGGDTSSVNLNDFGSNTKFEGSGSYTDGNPIVTDADSNNVYKDELEAITVQNQTNPDSQIGDLSSVNVYAGQSSLGTATWDGDSYELSGINRAIDGTDRFYVRADISETAQNDDVIKAEIPAVSGGATFEAGDEGLFLESGDAGGSNIGDKQNPNAQTIDAPTISKTVTEDNNDDGQIDRLKVEFKEAMDITDGNTDDGLPGLSISDTGWSIADADYAATDNTTLYLDVSSSNTNTAQTLNLNYDLSQDSIQDAEGSYDLSEADTETEKDGADPVITGVVTYDVDQDGDVGAATLTASEDVKGNLGNAGDYYIEGVAAESVNSDAYITNDDDPADKSDDNDDEFRIDLPEESEIEGTDAKNVSYNGSSASDGSGNYLVELTETDVVETDGAGPVVTEFEGELGNRRATINFSEPVDDGSDGSIGTGAFVTEANSSLVSVSHEAEAESATVVLDYQFNGTDSGDEIGFVSNTGEVVDPTDNSGSGTVTTDLQDNRNQISLTKGWNVISTPHVQAENTSELLSNVDYSNVYAYNDGDDQWETDTADIELDSMDAVYIKSEKPQELTLNRSSGAEVPPSTVLEKGWNLVGPSINVQNNVFEMKGDQALSSVVDLNNDNKGLDTVISPSSNLVSEWTDNDQEATPFQTKLEAFEGYWVYMDSSDELSGKAS